MLGTLVKRAAAAPRRPMKVPLTFAAKIAQFPWAMHVQKHWFFRYYAYAFCVSMPIFYWIQRKVGSPENIRFWEEKERLEMEEMKAHSAQGRHH